MTQRFTDREKPEKKFEHFSGAHNHSLGAGEGRKELHFSYVTETRVVVVAF